MDKQKFDPVFLAMGCSSIKLPFGLLLGLSTFFSGFGNCFPILCQESIFKYICRTVLEEA